MEEDKKVLIETIKKLEERNKELNIKLAEQEKEFDILYGKTKTQQMMIDELLAIIEKKEFQRVAQVLRSYGIKSEKENVIVNEAEIIKESSSINEKEEAKEIENILKGKTNKKKPGRKVGTKNFDSFDLEKIPTRDEYITREAPICDTCGELMKDDGEEITTKLVWHPGSFELIRYHERRYVCPRCDEKSFKNNIDIFNDNLASPSFVSNIINYKYNYAIPLYRQEEIYARIGVPISRVSLSKYVLLAAEALAPLYELMIRNIVRTDVKVLQADETTFKCILDSKALDRDKNYVFVYSTTYHEWRIRVYSYSKTRNASNPKEILKDYEGYLEVDGYDGYNDIPNVKVARCWTHARRKYADIVKTLKENQKKGSVAFKLVRKINELFKIEEECKRNKLIPTQVLKVRKERSKPIVDEYFDYIKSIKEEVGEPLLGAINYSLDLEDGLKMFLENGCIPLDNNLSERSIKPFVIMRKNALFAYSNEGAIASCILMSIVQTAKENLLDVEKYLTYVLTKINTIKTSELQDLLPYSHKIPKDLLIKVK